VPPVATSTYELPDSLAIGYDAQRPWDHAAAAVSPLIVRKPISAVVMRAKGLGPDYCERFLSKMSSNDTVISLDLSENQLGVDGQQVKFATAFSGVVAQNCTLTAIDLSGNFLRDAGIEVLKSAFQNSTTLRDLSLAKNCIGILGGEAIGHVIKYNTSITKLNVSSNDLRGDGVFAIAKALDTNCSLKELDISSNAMASVDDAVQDEEAGQVGTNDAVVELASVLTKKNITLEVLHMRNDEIGPEGGLSLAEMLRFDGALRELDISNNQIGDEAAVAIAQSMMTSPLLVLKMSGVGAEDDAGHEFAEVLKFNTKLTEVDLSTNSFGPGVGEVMAEVLKQENRTLESLNLSDNNMMKEGLEFFDDFNGACTVHLNNNR